MKAEYQRKNWAVVEWVDSSNAGGWRDEGESFEPVMCRSIGVILKETDEYITLAQTVGDDGKYANIVTIPLVAVTERLHARLRNVRR